VCGSVRAALARAQNVATDTSTLAGTADSTVDNWTPIGDGDVVGDDGGPGYRQEG
jgi:hypothetical protein